MPVVVWRHRHGKYRHDKRRADERRKGRLSHRAARDTRGGCWEWEKKTIGGIGVDGGCSLDMINLILRGARRWTDGDCVDRDWKSMRWRWKGSVGDRRRKDKDTGSEDKQEMVDSLEEKNGEIHWDGEVRRVSDELDDTQDNPRHNTV